MCENDERRYLTYEDTEYILKHVEIDDPMAKLILIKPRLLRGMEQSDTEV
ncbi:hypothetical protein [Halovenus salina]|uniref:Uncharacterized protein n=1 Tax=Halovenus salina TaxID=1510225 RepID=A0ABD5VUM5_9EURY|nr:hypothetical protein [Halovenus salina]